MSVLDIKISRGYKKFTTSVSRKPTFSRVFTNFGSFVPKSNKYGLLFSLLHRALKLYSNFEYFRQEIDNPKIVFENNRYPNSFIDLCNKKYVDTVFTKKEVILKASKRDLIASMCDSFRRAPLKLKSIYYNNSKEKYQMIISHMACFCRTGN